MSIVTLKDRFLYHPAVRDALLIFEGRIEKVQEMDKDVQKCAEVVDCYKPTFGEDISLTISVLYGGNTINVKVLLEDMNDILPILRRFRHEGYKCSTIVDNPSSNSRMWTLKCVEKDRKDPPRLYVEGVLKKGSTCEYVQVSTRVAPVFELRCSGRPPSPSVSLDIPEELK